MKAAFSLILTAATFIFSASLQAADRTPKEMRPKLLKKAQEAFRDDFSAEKISDAWILPKGDFAGQTSLKNGAVLIETGVGRQGYITRKLEAGVTDAGVQLLMKPLTSTWMGVRFTSAGDENAARHWKLATIIYASGVVRVVEPDASADENKLKVLQSAKVDVKPSEWWRVSVETEGEKYLVRVNGKEAIEIKHPAAAEAKPALLINLYGGTGLVDEISVTLPGK